MTLKKRILGTAIAIAMTLILVELGYRIYLQFRVGPSVLLYGTSLHRRHVPLTTDPQFEKSEPIVQFGEKPKLRNDRDKIPWREWKETRSVGVIKNSRDRYRKYFPNQKRFDIDVESGERFRVKINNRGFRGRDFADAKSPGVNRIVTLGGSSTFGYFNRDDETYPRYLDEELANRRSSSEVRFEVINMGIPHLSLSEIRALFFAEVIGLDPDYVTLYAGNNDAKTINKRVKQTASDRFQARTFIGSAAQFSIVAGVVDSFLAHRSKQPYLWKVIEREAGAISNIFIKHVAAIHRLCLERGVVFVVANQQKNSQSLPRELLKRMTYREEADLVRARLIRGDEMGRDALELLAHSVLMSDLAAWANANQVPLVDVIAALDKDRDVMVSTVHLSARGNRIVASVLADEILRRNDRNEAVY